MFKVHLINFGYDLQGEWPTLTAAIAAAKKAGFEAAILEEGEVVAHWHPLRGTEHF
jgi:hypothetical protein